ncbi:MAG TPA: heterodisulfide reductase-related iron-sulfur binding cluster [Candidatus Cybelea sp.]|jgi:glycolate oxidase iron-sulfur subunit|nr:heterodisulfide reductase-related iron-sulfur binding cluster [Candidatus Cybelea sp.]
MIEHELRGFTGSDQPNPSIYDTCIRCGLCLPSCPTYLETMTETSGPRGRISLIKAVGESRLDLLSPGFVEQMWQCLDCRACEAVCPSGVRYGQLVETARTQIERAYVPDREPDGHRLERRFLRALFGRLDLLFAAARVLRFAQQTRLIALARFFGLGRAAELAPQISGDFFYARGQRIEASRPQGVAFLHAGCIMPVAFASVHRATVRMLRRVRLSVVAPAGQGCCGAIAVHAGDMDFARELAKRNITAFERSGADVYVVNAAGCGSALKEYGELFAGDDAWAERAARFSARVRDVTEVLDAMALGTPSREIDATVTYQEPCHLAHAQRVASAPRRLLARVPGLRFVEMDESAVCCGSAGIYNLTEPEMATRLQRRKVAAIQRTGATIVATANPGCAIQVAAGLRDAQYRATVRHVVELLDQAYGEDEE